MRSLRFLAGFLAVLGLISGACGFISVERPARAVSIDPCALVTKPEVEAILGRPVSGPQLQTNPAEDFSCWFEFPPEAVMPVPPRQSAWVRVDVMGETITERDFLHELDSGYPQKDTTRVEGVGEAALFRYIEQTPPVGGWTDQLQPHAWGFLNVLGEHGVTIRIDMKDPAETDVARVRQRATDLARPALQRAEVQFSGKPARFAAPPAPPVDPCRLLSVTDLAIEMGPPVAMPTGRAVLLAYGPGPLGAEWECNIDPDGAAGLGLHLAEIGPTRDEMVAAGWELVPGIGEAAAWRHEPTDGVGRVVVRAAGGRRIFLNLGGNLPELQMKRATARLAFLATKRLETALSA